MWGLQMGLGQKILYIAVVFAHWGDTEWREGGRSQQCLAKAGCKRTSPDQQYLNKAPLFFKHLRLRGASSWSKDLCLEFYRASWAHTHASTSSASPKVLFLTYLIFWMTTESNGSKGSSSSRKHKTIRPGIILSDTVAAEANTPTTLNFTWEVGKNVVFRMT